VTTTSVTGGECFAAIFQQAIGSVDQVTASISQAGSSVSTTVTVASTGGNFSYSGSVGQSALTATLNSCSACNVISARCPGTGVLRDIRLQTGAINGTVVGNSITGTESETFNVFVAGTTIPVGALVISNALNLTRQ
jgi:hypothetical protein